MRAVIILRKSDVFCSFLQGTTAPAVCRLLSQNLSAIVPVCPYRVFEVVHIDRFLKQHLYYKAIRSLNASSISYFNLCACVWV